MDITFSEQNYFCASQGRGRPRGLNRDWRPLWTVVNGTELLRPGGRAKVREALHYRLQALHSTTL